MLDWNALDRSHRRRQWAWGAAYIIGLGLVCAAFAMGVWHDPSPILSAEMREDVRTFMLAVVFADALRRMFGFTRKPAGQGEKLTSENNLTLVVAAGDCGVYVGLSEGGALALSADGRLILTRARHLRNTVTKGRTGSGSALELAALGLDPSSPSVSPVLHGNTGLVGVRRVFDVAPEAVASFEEFP